jgi:hypothetical protein
LITVCTSGTIAPPMELRDRARRVARSLPFRAAVAALFLTAHVVAMIEYGAVRLHVPFDRNPTHAPYFNDPRSELHPQNWDRLVVSRWDTANYIGLMLRGYKYCPARVDVRREDIYPILFYCKVDFYPGFAALGWVASLGGRVGSPDYVLFVISLLASFLVMMMWTSRPVTDALGVWGAYCSLIVLNTYTSGFMLATPQTEPWTLAFTLGAFLALERRWFLVGALLAGAASAMRVNGFCASMAYGLALVVETWHHRPPRVWGWVRRAGEAVLAGWGQFGLSLYYWYKFNDPMVYARAHQRAFGHAPRLRDIFLPDWTWIYGSLREMHEVIYLFAAVLMFALGHRRATRGFSPAGRTYIYAQFIATFLVIVYGSADIFYAGTTRYTLVLFGGFFAAGMVLKRHGWALLVCVAANLWHYWFVEMCFYAFHNQPGAFHACIVR